MLLMQEAWRASGQELILPVLSLLRPSSAELYKTASMLDLFFSSKMFPEPLPVDGRLLMPLWRSVTASVTSVKPFPAISLRHHRRRLTGQRPDGAVTGGKR